MNKQNDNNNAKNESKKDNAQGERMISNMEKYENYKTQFERLKLAMDNAFYLEAIFIEYAIMEDRTASILSYEKDNHWSVNARTPLKTKLDNIKEHANPNTPNTSVIERYFSDDKSDNLLDKIDAWRNDRNPLTHRLMDLVTTTNELREIAEQGETLCKELSNRATNYKRMVERNNAKQDAER